MKLRILLFTFSSKNKIKENPSKIRGFFTKKFSEYILLHHHLGDRLIYKYPLIQYKIIKKKPIILGINAGIEVLKEIYDKYENVELNGNLYEIVERGLIIKESEFGIARKFLSYKFITPYLALNEENYEKYINLCSSNISSRSNLLEKILIGNILSISKSLGYIVTDEIKVKARLRPVKAKLKNTKFIGFLGKFETNFEIPDYFGLGKSVSRGFGTVIKNSSNLKGGK